MEPGDGMERRRKMHPRYVMFKGLSIPNVQAIGGGSSWETGSTVPRKP